MTLVMKSKNVCLLYLPVISRGENRGGGTKGQINTLTNITGKKKKEKMILKRREKEHKTFSLIEKQIPLRVKSCLKPESGDVIPVYSGYEIPSFSLPLSLFLSCSDHLFLSLCFLSLSISAVSTSAFCNFKQNSS